LVEAVTGEGETAWVAEFADDEFVLESDFERGLSSVLLASPAAAVADSNIGRQRTARTSASVS
jgi:hypothetical protein